MSDFDRFAKNYKNTLDQAIGGFGQDSTYFTEYKASYIKRLAGDRFSGKILDHGCGVGFLSLAVAKALPDARLTGFDISRESVNIAQGSNDSSMRFTWNEADLDQDYDLVIVSNVFHHIPPAQRKGKMGEIAEKVTAGGKLVIFEHNPMNPLTRLVVSRCPFDEDAVLLQPSELISFLSPSRIRLLRKDYIVFFPPFLKFFQKTEPYFRILPIGAQYVIVGEKDESS